MADREQVKKLKCPYCGWIRTVHVNVIEDELMATAVQGMSDALKAAAERIKTLLADTRLDEANAWVDMPKCPHCENVYRYNVRTGEVAK